MQLTFQTKQYNETVTTIHDNFSEDATWMELTELFWKHLNSVSYHIDRELMDVMLEAAENLQAERFHQLLNND